MCKTNMSFRCSQQRQWELVYPRSSRSLLCLYLQGGVGDKELHSTQQEVLQPLPSAWGYSVLLKLAKSLPSQPLGGRVIISLIISDIFSNTYWCFFLQSQSLSALTRARYPQGC